MFQLSGYCRPYVMNSRTDLLRAPRVGIDLIARGFAGLQ